MFDLQLLLNLWGQCFIRLWNVGWMMDMRSALKYSTARLSPAIMWLWNIIQPEIIRKKTFLVWPTHNTWYESLTFEVTGKTGELLTAWNVNENSMWRDSSEFLVFSSLECLLQTTAPISASRVSKAKQRSLPWRFEALACCWPAHNPWRKGKRGRGREKEQSWATEQCFWLTGNLPEVSGLLATHLEVEKCGMGLNTLVLVLLLLSRRYSHCPQ